MRAKKIVILMYQYSVVVKGIENKLIELGDTGIEPGTELPVRMCRFLEEVSAGGPVTE